MAPILLLVATGISLAVARGRKVLSFVVLVGACGSEVPPTGYHFRWVLIQGAGRDLAEMTPGWDQQSEWVRIMVCLAKRRRRLSVVPKVLALKLEPIILYTEVHPY